MSSRLTALLGLALLARCGRFDHLPEEAAVGHQAMVAMTPLWNLTLSGASASMRVVAAVCLILAPLALAHAQLEVLGDAPPPPDEAALRAQAAKLEEDFNAAQARAARSGDDKISCDDIHAELVTLVQSPGFQQVISQQQSALASLIGSSGLAGIAGLSRNAGLAVDYSLTATKPDKQFKRAQELKGDLLEATLLGGAQETAHVRFLPAGHFQPPLLPVIGGKPAALRQAPAPVLPKVRDGLALVWREA